MKKAKWRIFALLLMWCSAITAFGQQKTVKGQVVDENGESVIGAAVMVKGRSGGTITDVDGTFEISVDTGNETLVFSSLGYGDEEIPLNGRAVLKVTLKEEFNELDEVTVVAYGSQKTETLTGAISAVGTEALLNVRTTLLIQIYNRIFQKPNLI